MILNVYAFYDIKASFYSAPFFLVHDSLAMRAATDLVADPNTTIGRHPADFALMKLGTFDDQTGNFEVGLPMNLAICTAFLPRPVQGDLV